MSENTNSAGRSGVLGTVSRSPEATYGAIGRARRVVVVGIIRRHHAEGERVELYANGPAVADQPETGPATVAVHSVRRRFDGSSWETWHVQPWGQDMPREGWQASGAGIAVFGLPGMPAAANAEVVIALHDHREHLDVLSQVAATERVEASDYLDAAAREVSARRHAVRQAQADVSAAGVDFNDPAAVAVLDPAMRLLRAAERDARAAEVVGDAVAVLQSPAPYPHRDAETGEVDVLSALDGARHDVEKFAAAVRDPHPSYTPDHVLVLVGAGQVAAGRVRDLTAPTLRAGA